MNNFIRILPSSGLSLASGLHLGRVNLMLNSVYPANQGPPAMRPEFNAKEHGLGGTPARQSLPANVVPEPSSAAQLAAGADFQMSRIRRICS